MCTGKTHVQMWLFSWLFCSWKMCVSPSMLEVSTILFKCVCACERVWLFCQDFKSSSSVFVKNRKTFCKILHMPNVTSESDKFAESPQNKLKCFKIKKKLLAVGTTFGCFAFCSSDFSSSFLFFFIVDRCACICACRRRRRLLYGTKWCVYVALFVHKVYVLWYKAWHSSCCWWG